MTLLRLGLFVLSSAGWCLLLSYKLGLKATLCPFVFASGVGAVQLAAGLLNIYVPAEAALWLGGLALLGFYALRCRAAFAPFASLRTAAFGLAAGWLLFLARGGLIAGHDNMSHWAVMAKTMLRFGRLPNAQNTAIEFTAYPPGSAGWIKYFCGCVGVSDGMMVYAQGLLLLAGCFALLALVPARQKGVWPGCLLAAATAVFLLVGDIPPVDLRVDALLAVQAAGTLAVLLCYGPRQPKKAALAALAPLVLQAVIKNSGLFFAAANGLVLACFTLRACRAGAAEQMAGPSAPEAARPGRSAVQARPASGWNGPVCRRLLPPMLLAVLAPFVSFWLWMRHVAMVFPQAAMNASGEASKHALSLAGYARMLGGKTAEEVRAFAGMFARHFVDFTQADTRCLWVLALGTALLLAWLAAAGRMPARRAAGLGAALAGCELCYIGCLFGTYLFSMNTAEMLCLASITRYHLTALLYLAAALVLILLSALGQPEAAEAGSPAQGRANPASGAGRPAFAPSGPAVLLAAALLLAGLTALSAPGQLSALYSRAPYRDSSTQGEWLALRQQYGLEDGRRCLVYTRGGDPEELDTWSMRYVARYVLNTDTVDFWQFEEQEYTLQELYGRYDYLILYAPDEHIRALLAENGLDPAAGCVALIQ